MTGSARHFGKPIPATVYVNGKENEQFKVFYTDEPNNYLISMPGYESSGMLTFLHINLDEKSIGRSTGTSKGDYDFIGGHLFQSKTAGHFSPVQDQMKGSNFDPGFSVDDKQIKFNLPPGKFEFDSIRMKLD